jgi:hypothetical protein
MGDARQREYLASAEEFLATLGPAKSGWMQATVN